MHAKLVVLASFEKVVRQVSIAAGVLGASFLESLVELVIEAQSSACHKSYLLAGFRPGSTLVGVGVGSGRMACRATLPRRCAAAALSRALHRSCSADRDGSSERDGVRDGAALLQIARRGRCRKREEREERLHHGDW